MGFGASLKAAQGRRIGGSLFLVFEEFPVNARDKDGWNGEDFSILEPNGLIRPNFRPRPYPRHTAGMPRSFQYQSAGGPCGGAALAFTWDHDPGCGDTEIFIPNALFGPRPALQVQPADVACCWDPTRQLVVCRAPRPTTVRLTITTGPVAP